MSSSLTFLLMTSRRRCVPASGANVSEPVRTVEILSISSFVKLSARSDGSESEIFRSSVHVSSSSVSSLIQL